MLGQHWRHSGTSQHLRHKWTRWIPESRPVRSHAMTILTVSNSTRILANIGNAGPTTWHLDGPTTAGGARGGLFASALRPPSRVAVRPPRLWAEGFEPWCPPARVLKATGACSHRAHKGCDNCMDRCKRVGRLGPRSPEAPPVDPLKRPCQSKLVSPHRSLWRPWSLRRHTLVALPEGPPTLSKVVLPSTCRHACRPHPLLRAGATTPMMTPASTRGNRIRLTSLTCVLASWVPPGRLTLLWKRLKQMHLPLPLYTSAAVLTRHLFVAIKADVVPMSITHK